MALSKAKLRKILSPTDLLIVVMLLKRFLGKNKDIIKFLNKIDEPSELERLYEAILTVVNIVEDVEDDEKVAEV